MCLSERIFLRDETRRFTLYNFQFSYDFPSQFPIFRKVELHPSTIKTLPHHTPRLPSHSRIQRQDVDIRYQIQNNPQTLRFIAFASLPAGIWNKIFDHALMKKLFPEHPIARLGMVIFQFNFPIPLLEILSVVHGFWSGKQAQVYSTPIQC
jgi:hypothetical protein